MSEKMELEEFVERQNSWLGHGTDRDLSQYFEWPLLTQSSSQFDPLPTQTSSMTPEQADLIRKSFDAMWSMRDDIADLWYRRFFELAPDARHLFPSDMERQRVMLMDMIAAMVGSLDQRALFQSLGTQSGRQHARFGVQPSHYVAFGEALMWSLECKFGASFTPELRGSWRALYAVVQVEMLRAAAQA